MNPEYSPLAHAAFRLLKYFLLGLFGFALVCVLASVFGAWHLALLLGELLGKWILRVGFVVLSVVAVAVVKESLRQ